MAGKRWLTVSEIIKAIEIVGPYQGKIAKHLGVTFEAIWLRKKKNKKIAAAYFQAEEELKDKAEQTVNHAIDLGDAKIAMEYLKTRGKDRGYATRVEQTGADGGPMRQAIGPDLENLTDDALQHYIAGLAKAAAGLASDPTPGMFERDHPQE